MVVTTEAMFLLCIWVLVMALLTRNVVQGLVCVVATRGIVRSVGLTHGVAIAFVPLFFGELNAVTVYDEAAVCNKAVVSGWITLNGHKSDIQRLIKRDTQNEMIKPIRPWLKTAEQVS